MPIEETPATAAPVDAAPVDVAPVDVAPVDAAPADTAPASVDTEPATSAAKAPKTEAPKVEDAEVESSWDGSAWDGDIESVPSDARPVAEAVANYYKAIVEEHEQMLARYDEYMRNDQHPDFDKVTQELAQARAEMEERVKELEETRTAKSSYETKLAEQERQMSALQQQQIDEFTRDYAKRYPNLVDETTKEGKRLQEILDDEGEEDLWDVYDFPQLVELDKKTFGAVKKMRREGVPTNYALQLAAKTVEEEAKFPVDAIAGARAPGARPTSPTKITDKRDLNSAIDSVASNTLLKFRGRTK